MEFSQGVGVALGMKLHKLNQRVFILLGDGECDEGSNWEAAQAASHFHLNNLVVIIDANKLQYDGYTTNIMNHIDLYQKLKSFGFYTVEVDGHDLEALNKAFTSAHDEMPLAVIAHTIKGKGVSFIENNPAYHTGSLTKEQYEQALAELGFSVNVNNQTSKEISNE